MYFERKCQVGGVRPAILRGDPDDAACRRLLARCGFGVQWRPGWACVTWPAHANACSTLIRLARNGCFPCGDHACVHALPVPAGFPLPMHVVTSGMKCKHQAPHEEWRAHGSWLPPDTGCFQELMRLRHCGEKAPEWMATVNQAAPALGEAMEKLKESKPNGNLAQFLYKSLTTLQLPPFSTINKPPCLTLLPHLLNNHKLLLAKLSVPVALWAALNSVEHLPPFNQCLLLHNIVVDLLSLPLLLSHSAAPGSGSGSGSGSVAASASVYESRSGSVSTPDFATNPPFPYPIRQYQHLPANLAAQLAAIPPPQQRVHVHAPVSFNYIYFLF
ncbi:hypothetical protein F5148DRAFT_1148889 [Russula earlei]|uniref:Uncharacterized protein n=1 Tax=Russula earlei TaxID=71964 RepID=A0ACC0UAJ4_9AGAM|nr:hypothetical protein F5148DRAFT_1148889 [Russula earlei]